MGRKKKKNSKLIRTTKNLVVGGVGISAGSMVASKLPASAATTSVQKGFTTYAKFTPLMATAGAMGVVTHQLRKIKKKTKKMKGGMK